MAKITGKETREQLPEKVLLLYEAVGRLIEEDADIENLSVLDITQKAGIGKGTAYDYFETKEEIIMYAILFNLEQTMEQFTVQLMENGTFRERITFALNAAGQNMKERNCILKYVHLMLGASQVGKLLRERMESTFAKECPPLELGFKMIREGVSSGELRDDLPVSYMVYILLTKIFAYMTFQRKKQEGEVSDEQFRQLVLTGILTEFEKR